MKSIGLTFLCLFMAPNIAKRIEMCELFNYLKDVGMHGYLGYGGQHIICLTKYSTDGNTRYYENDHGIPYYGIFRLSGLKWCTNGRHPSQNICKVHCDKFLDDDIDDDLACVKKIMGTKEGFNHWVRYQEYCDANWVEHHYLICFLGLHNEKWWRPFRKHHFETHKWNDPEEDAESAKAESD